MRCKACQLKDADALTDEIKRGGYSLADLSKRYKVSYPTIARHRDHILESDDEKKDDSEIKQELRTIKEELREARARNDHVQVKSLLGMVRDYRNFLRKEVEQGEDLESRFRQFCSDSELQLEVLGALVDGRGWNMDNPCWHDRQLAAQEAIKIQKAFERRVKAEHVAESRAFSA